jgi:hypothetical protein
VKPESELQRDAAPARTTAASNLINKIDRLLKIVTKCKNLIPVPYFFTFINFQSLKNKEIISSNPYVNYVNP